MGAAEIVGSLLGLGASIYGANKSAAAQRAASAEQARAMDAQAAALNNQTTPSETASDISASVQSNRRRVAAMQGLTRTVSGASNNYTTGGSNTTLGS